MTTFNSVEELKTESQTFQEIAADYFHLAQKARRRVGFRPESWPRGVTSTRSAGRTVKPNPHHV